MLRTFDAQHFASAKLGFVDPGKNITDGEIAELGFERDDFDEIVHTDTGLGRFDHHDAERGMQKDVSATSLTYDHCCEVHPELYEDKALQELVKIVTELDHFGECFWPEANHSRYSFQLHEILSGVQRAGLHTDETQLAFGMKCLDGVYKTLEELENAKEQLTKGIEFETKWGKGIGVETNNDAVIKYAQKAGYAIVIKKDPDEFHARIKGIPIEGLDLTPLAEAVMAKDKIGSWYFHPAKTMLLNGSEKQSKDKAATPLTLNELIAMAKETLL